MNERIKQLLGQAYDEAVPETWTTLSSEQLGRVYDKFAELIVRECANIATINAHQWASPGTYVLKHFGVEE